MKFLDFCIYLQKLEEVSSRNTKIEILSELLSKISIQEVREVMYLLNGRIAAKYEPIEFNFSVKMLLNSIQLIVEENEKGHDIKAEYSKIGDIGDFTYKIRKGYKDNENKAYEILEIYKLLQTIAYTSGKGSQALKISIFSKLFKEVSALEVKYIARIIVGSLRLGMNEKTLIDALSWVKAGDKSLKKIIEAAMGVRSDIGLIAEDVLKTELNEINKKFENYTIIPGVPIASKLVERERGVGAVFERIPEGFLQPKLDGLRAQIHKYSQNGQSIVKVFSRNFEDITEMFPDLVEAAKEIPISSFVIDSEAVAYNFENKRMLPFQDTIQRKRKHDVDDVSKQIPVRSMFFDVLYFEGKDLSRLPIEKRIPYLDEIGKHSKYITKLQTIKFDSEIVFSEFFEDCLRQGLEGVIVKKTGTVYEAGTRNFDWIKLKASSKSELVDTIDAVVMGYYIGTGARNKFGLGALLVGVYNEKEDRYETVAKVGTGITDEQFVTIKSDLLGITRTEESDKYFIVKSLEPDVYVDPKIVVEVEADELTISKVHTACIGKFDDDKGISMRFPRLKVWGRDKDPEQATSTEELFRMYELRKKK